MVETLITSSVLILGICLLRFLLKGRISPQLQYGIWSIAALRLMFPLLYPFFGRLKNIQSRFSVMNAAEIVLANAAPGSGRETAAIPSAMRQMNYYAAPVTVAERAAGTDWQFIILMIWVSGSILLLAWMICTNLHFSRKLYFQRERYTGDTYGETSLPVYYAKMLKSPCFMVYLGDKGIYLPANMENETENLRYILVHETCHARHYDHLWSALRCILLCVYWVNPLVWAAAFLSKRDCELACDASAVRRLGEEERFSYGRMLIDLAADKRHVSGFFCISSEMNNGKKAMKERIMILAKHPSMTKITKIFIPFVSIVLVLCTYTGENSRREIYKRSYQWAEAFCSRDGNTLKEMYNLEHPDDFYQIELVQSQPEDDFVSFGWSSPWPMENQYKVFLDQRTAEITYYAVTSDPHCWVWKEWLTWKKVGKNWYADQESFAAYDRIDSVDEFKEAYGGRISDTPMNYKDNGMGGILNEQKEDPVYEDLLIPERAMEYLLNLHGGYGIALTNGDTTTVLYTFSDGGKVAVTMVRPYGENGIWVPEEVTDVPEVLLDQPEETVVSETIPGTRQEDNSGSITFYDVVKLAGVSDAERLEIMTKGFPEPDRVEWGEDDAALNMVEWYEFIYKKENYALQISYEKENGNLYYIAVQRLATGEWLTIYETPEETARYGTEIPDEEGIREFFETHKSMADDLTYNLPEGLSDGGYLEMLGNGGGNLFVTTDPKGIARLEIWSNNADLSFAPVSWRSSGAVERYTGNGLYKRIENGNLLEVGLPWNHSVFLSDPVSITDCEAPALVILAEHDLFTPSALEEAETEHRSITEENQTSRMWYVFFAKEDSEQMYSISLNADLYEREDILKVARSVHFKDDAWVNR